MISGNITVSSVHYDASFRRLFPLILSRTRSMSNPGMAVDSARPGRDDSPGHAASLSKDDAGFALPVRCWRRA